MPKTPTKTRTVTAVRSSPYSSPTKNSTTPRGEVFPVPSYAWNPSTPTKSPRKTASMSTSPSKRGSSSTNSPRTPRAGNPVDYKFNFGKHKGKSISEVPWSYIRWCIDEGVVANRLDLKVAVEEFQKQKRLGSTSSSPRKTQTTTALRASTSTAAAEPLLSIDQRRAQLKQTISEWLYDECLAVLEAGEYDFMMSNSQLRERTLERLEKLEKMAKSDFPKQYPLRPPATYTLPESSKSVKELRRVLSKCPNVCGSFRDPTEEEKKYLVFHSDGFSGKEWYTISEDYEATIKRCLKDVEKEHGMGARQIANWEVRDKYAKCISGINYAGGGKNFCEYYQFVDDSTHWLQT
ncbi:hypothetical protein D9758_009281 [Tetrapyrgos nigripes]|uniref:Uncharacterized protein n=1 Tax=Tetrapyrgos nigripes TaxID=182062 RepID=A0A8H5GH85_9AGAR|nr:hypothetical protein D9758_009281 [Tetrapyrgos nigripes]